MAGSFAFLSDPAAFNPNTPCRSLCERAGEHGYHDGVDKYSAMKQTLSRLRLAGTSSSDTGRSGAGDSRLGGSGLGVHGGPPPTEPALPARTGFGSVTLTERVGAHLHTPPCRRMTRFSSPTVSSFGLWLHSVTHSAAQRCTAAHCGMLTSRVGSRFRSGAVCACSTDSRKAARSEPRSCSDGGHTLPIWVRAVHHHIVSHRAVER